MRLVQTWWIESAGRNGIALSTLKRSWEKWRLVWATLDSRKPFRDFVYCSVGGNGSPMCVKASGKPVFDGNGEFRRYRGAGADVTASRSAQEAHERLRQLESDLAHMNRLSVMGELAASLVHEVTQPIGSARNNARAALNFLDNDPPDLGEVREALGCVVGDADRARDIINRIRPHIEKAAPQKDRISLNEVIGLARSAIAENGVSVPSGVGMRLSICRSIIDAHEGRLWAEANAPRGAVFQFTLPGADNELTNSLQADHQNGAPHGHIALDGSHQRACEGNKRLHPSERGPGRRHRDRPSRGSSESHTPRP
jgi:hypothetical protein